MGSGSDTGVVIASGESGEFSVHVRFDSEREKNDVIPTDNSVGWEEDDEDDIETCTEDETEDTAALVKLTTGVEGEGEREGEREGGKKRSSILGASFNFTNSIIGAGIIGIPAAIRLAGFIPGVVLLVLVAVITDYTVLLLIKNGIISNKFSYQEMITEAFGRVGFWILTITQLLFPFLATAGYVVIVGDTLSRIVEEFFVLADSDPPGWAISTSLIKTVTILLIMLPLSLLRNIAMLEKFSALAVLFVTAIVLFTVVKAATYYCSVRCFLPSCCDTPLSIWLINTHFIESVGIMAFAFVCHHNTYLIYGSLVRRSYTRFSKVSHFSVSGSAVFCSVLGLAGFLSFMNETRGDLLNNYCVDDWAATVARFLYACVIMLTFPIEIFVCREVLEIVLSRLPYRTISWIGWAGLRRAFDRFLYSPRHSSLARHITLTVSLVVGSLGVGLTTDDLGVILGFSGCLMATPMAFILPTASYLKLTRSGRSHWYSRDRLTAWVVMVIGVIVMVIGTALSIEQAVKSFSHTETSRLAYCPDPGSAHQSLATCCSLINSTRNFSLHVPLCDCSSLCHNITILTHSPSKQHGEGVNESRDAF